MRNPDPQLHERPDGGADAPPSPSTRLPSPPSPRSSPTSRVVPARLRLVPAGSSRRLAVKPLGTTPIGKPELIGMSVPDARHHVHILGPTGTGKSTLLIEQVLADVHAGRGVAVFDPKGDLVRDLLARLPESAADRLVLIDPDEKQAPAALNLFDLGGDPADTADQLVGVMAKVWSATWGNRTDDLARHAVLTLAHLPGSTLADLPVLLADPAYRAQVLRRVRKVADPLDVVGIDGFWAWYDSQSPGEMGRQAGPLLSKLRAVLSRRFAANLLGTACSTFRLQDILDGGILLVRLPKPVLGDDTVRLTGSLLLSALLRAAGARGEQEESDRLDATLLIDEGHNFLNLPIGLDDALAELRGLHLSLVVAHQHRGQLSAEMAAAIDANARNKVLFALAPSDARAMAHHVSPYFAAEDLSRRDAYGVVCRLVINGRDGEPFSLTTRPAPPPQPGRAELLRQAARARGLPTEQRLALAEARLLRGARLPTAGSTTGTPASVIVPRQRTGPGDSPGHSVGGSPGPSTVQEPPPEPPTPTPLTAQVTAPVAPPRRKSD